MVRRLHRAVPARGPKYHGILRDALVRDDDDAGDLNGDGYGDVVVGTSSGQEDGTGRADVYLGGLSGLSRATALLGMDGDLGLFGWAVTAGDVNGDGYSDLVISAPGAGTSLGHVHVYAGGVRVSLTPAMTVTATETPAVFGHSISTGDANGDGYTDILVGAPGSNGSAGRIHLYFGAASMLPTVPVSWDGPAADARLGLDVTCAADLDADGFSEIVANTLPFRSVGSVMVYRGAVPRPATAATVVIADPAGPDAGFGFGVSLAP